MVASGGRVGSREGAVVESSGENVGFRLVAVGRDSAIERQLELEAVAERSGGTADRAAATSAAEGPGLATQPPAKRSFRPLVGYKTIRGSQPAAVPDQIDSRTHAFAVKPPPLHLQGEEAGRISGGEDAFAPVARSTHEAQEEAKEVCSPQRGPATGRGLQRWPLADGEVWPPRRLAGKLAAGRVRQVPSAPCRGL